MSTRKIPALPDPTRTGGPVWLARTGGTLSAGECLHGAVVAANQQIRNLLERAVPSLVKRLDIASLPPVPDSRLVKRAEEAALDQNDTLRMHGFRSALFARALAFGDRIDVDLELLYVCGLLHDDGLMKHVVGEDFTLRSAATARKVAEAAGEGAAIALALEDAVLVHTTVGVTASRDGALGAYTQFGAMVDLTGLRLRALPETLVRTVLETYPRGLFKREILRRFEAEAQALPRGRFAFARRVGFAFAVSSAPFPT